MDDFIVKPLPPDLDLESKAVLKQVVKAGRALAELKGVSKTIPNEAYSLVPCLCWKLKTAQR